MRADQERDQDSIRRDCITAEIDDLDVSLTHSDTHVWMSFIEPKQVTNPAAKFQFKITWKAFGKLGKAISSEWDNRPNDGVRE